MGRRICLYLFLFLLAWPALSRAKMGAVPGPGIVPGHIIASRGCAFQACPITVAVGDYVGFSAEGYEDVDYYYDPEPVMDRCYLENWQFEGGHLFGDWVVWDSPGTYQVTCQVGDAMDWADDVDHPTMTATVNVVQDLRIASVYSTDGQSISGAGGGTIGIDVEWIGANRPELQIIETSGLHPLVEAYWSFYQETTEPCSLRRRGTYVWHTPMHAPEEYHNATWSIVAELTYGGIDSGPLVSRDETTMDLKNLLVEGVGPDLLKHDPDNPSNSEKTISGQTTDPYTLNPEVARTDVDIWIYSVGGLVYPFDGTLVHHDTIQQDGPGAFTYAWDGTMNEIGGLPALKGLYAADVYATQGYPGGAYFPHYDSHSFRSGDIFIGPVALECGAYDKDTHSRPFTSGICLRRGRGIPRSG